MTVVGGLRARLIFDSVYNMINDSLTDLGWFDSGREHLPIQMTAEMLDPENEIPFNTLTLSADDITSADVEIGSTYAEHNRFYFIDFYAENDAVGEHMIFDLRDILDGRMPSIGRSAPTVDVYDYRTQPAPPKIFYVEIEGVFVERSGSFVKPWQRYWWTISFSTLDYYANENDA